MRVLVASANPVKIGAAQQALRVMFPDINCDVQGIPCPLDLPAQPWGQQQTRDCALQRALFLQSHDPAADLCIGMEGGVELAFDALGREQLYQIVWIVILDRAGNSGESSAATFILPPALSALVKAGDELGTASDTVFAQSNSKQKTGTTGLLTGDAVTRLDLYAQPTTLALVPFRNAGIYSSDMQGRQRDS